MSRISKSTNPGQVVWQLRQAGLTFNTILDVGIRAETPFLKSQFPKSRQFLFEPMSEWYETIRNNYAELDYELVECACSNEDGETEFVAEHKTTDIELPSHGRMISDSAKSPGSVSVVKTIKLDTFVAERGLKEPFFLKVDVDGAESLVLEGAVETLKSCDVVVLEMNRRKFLDLASFMHAHGFFVHSISGLAFGRPTADVLVNPEDPGTGLLQCDIFFMPLKYLDDPRVKPTR